MKKLLLTLGTATAIATPVASVVACGYQAPHIETRYEKDSAIYSKMSQMNQDLIQVDFFGGTPQQKFINGEFVKYANGDDDKRYNVELHDDDNKGMVTSGKEYTLRYVKGVSKIFDYFKENIAHDVFHKVKYSFVTSSDTENYNYYETRFDSEGYYETHRQEIKRFHARATFGPYVQPKSVDIETDYSVAIKDYIKVIDELFNKTDGTPRTDTELKAYWETGFAPAGGASDWRYAKSNMTLHKSIEIVNWISSLSPNYNHYDKNGNLKATGNDRDQEVY